MKKFILSAVCFAAVSLMGFDLSSGNFKVSEEGKSKIVAGEKFFSSALRLDAAGSDKDLTAVYTHKLPFIAGREYELSAEIKGQGTAFLEIAVVGLSGKVYSRRVATKQASAKYTDIEGKWDLRKYDLPELPASVQITIGVTKGSNITFYDIELEMEK